MQECDPRVLLKPDGSILLSRGEWPGVLANLPISDSDGEFSPLERC